jgi:uncharacterized protein (DUF2267 family)
MATMDYPTILERVERDADLGNADADQAVRATLATLAERLTEDQAIALGAVLPQELQPLLEGQGDAEVFEIEEFVTRVATREGTLVDEAERHVHVVFAALDLQQRMAPGVGGGAADGGAADPFLARIAERAGLDEAAAQRAAAAVLETLGERITAGEAEDIEPQLPPEYREPLHRGAGRHRGKAEPFDLREFLRRVAEREGVRPSEAEEHARAVLQTLRETISEKEFDDMWAQIPDEFRVLLRSPDAGAR